ncbi:MAG: hypothetical protein ACUVV0_08710 [Anaerolineae bacterium]
MSKKPEKRKCNYPGCRAWAMHDHERCRAHRDIPRSFYDSHYSDREIALIATFLNDFSLDDELWMTRVVNDRLLARLFEEGINDEMLVKIASILFKGADRVAKLLQTRRVLSGEAAEGFNVAFTRMLDELNQISGWNQKL